MRQPFQQESFGISEIIKDFEKAIATDSEYFKVTINDRMNSVRNAVEELREAFNLFDTEGTGKVDLYEFACAMYRKERQGME